MIRCQFKLFLIIICATTYLFPFTITKQSAQTEKLGYGNWYIDTDGELLLMKQFLKPGNVVFDVGANFGEWSTFALQTEPAINLVSFEPVPEVFQKLQTNLSARNSCQLQNVALSDASGTANFYYYCYPPQDAGLSSFYYRQVLHGDHQEPVIITVNKTTLDQFCAEHAIGKIDFMKIDTEGSEWAILCGAGSLLKNHQIRAIQFEYGGCYIDAKTTLKQVAQLLTRNGYVLFRIYEQGLIHIAQWDSCLENYNLSNYFAICQEDLPAYQVMQF